MKKLLLYVAAVAVIGFGSCKKANPDDDALPTNNKTNTTTTKDPFATIVIPTEQEYLAYDFTGLWCHACGSYGIPKFEELIVGMNSSQVNPLSVHSGDKFSCALGNGMLTFFAPSGFPNFGYDLVNIGNSVYTTKDSISKFLGMPINPVASVGIGTPSLSSDGKTYTVYLKTKFMQAASGTYNIAVILSEDGLKENQTTTGGAQAMMTHNHVIRGGSSSWLGQQLATGTIAANKTYNTTINCPIDLSWNPASLRVTAVIYKMKNSTTPEAVVNCNSNK